MLKTNLFMKVVLLLSFAGIMSVTNTFGQRAAADIVIDLARGNVTKFYAKQAVKTYKIGFKVLVTHAVYGSLYRKFESGTLDLDEDHLRGSPRYSGFSKNALFENEFAFQWRMVKYLEDRGMGNNRSLKLHKERLFAEQEAVDRGNKDEQFFNNIRSMRLGIVRLRSQVR